MSAASQANRDSAEQGAPPPTNLVASMVVGCALVGFDAGAVGYVLPALREATGADAHTASWLISAYVLGMLVGIPVAGGAAMRFGANTLFRIGLVLALSGAALALSSHSVAALLAARALQGLGQGPLPALATTLVAQRWPVQRQGRVIGTLALAYGAAFLAATVLMPLLLSLSWRASFALSLGAAAAALLVAHRPASAGAAGTAPDTCAAGVPAAAAAPDGFTAREGLRNVASIEMAAAAVLSVGTGVGQAMLVWFPTLAIARLGVSTTATSLLMLPLVAGGIAATLAITAWLDRLGARRMIGAGAIASTAGFLVAVLMPPSQAAFMAGVGVFGFGIVSLCAGPLRLAVARAVPASGQGPAQSAIALLTNLGLLGGNMLLGALAADAAHERAGVETALLVAGSLMTFSFLALGGLRAHGNDRIARPARAIADP